MTTGALGPYSAGWAPLYVFETTTNQVGIYRVQVQQTVGTAPTTRPQFDLVELRSFAKTATAAQPRAGTCLHLPKSVTSKNADSAKIGVIKLFE